jgi:hypothetical protein
MLNIKVTATDTAGASVSTTFKLTIGESTAIDQLEEQPARVFPNPTSGVVNISLASLPRTTAVAEIYNLQGKVIRKDTFRKDIRIDLSDCPKGIYFLRLLVDNEITVSKIILQ